MTVVDAVRFAFFAVFGVGAAFMLATNVLAFQVLRPAKTLGFLWWHVTTVSVALASFGVVALSLSAQRLGHDTGISWTTVLTAVGVVAFVASQVIIFSVERRRFIYQRSVLTGQVDLAAPPRTPNVW